jgi:hypothetical protein
MTTPATTTTLQWNPLLVDQLDFHWQHQLRPRLEGLTDEEYFWEPVPGTWSVRPRGTSSAPVQAGGGDFTIDFAFPEPDPPPVTTIAWRIGHIIVGCLAMRTASHFGRQPADYQSWPYAGSADEELARPCGPAEGPYADSPMARLVLHINRELIHHGAEISLLRDLYAHRPHDDRRDG